MPTKGLHPLSHTMDEEFLPFLPPFLPLLLLFTSSLDASNHQHCH
jgi:hypothetical protein